MKLKTGDTVIVITGKDRGKTGKILKAFPREDKILVEGVNVLKGHQRGRQAGKKGQVSEKTMPIHVSHALVLDPKTKKGTRVGYKKEGDKTVRIGKKSGAVVS